MKIYFSGILVLALLYSSMGHADRSPSFPVPCTVGCGKESVDSDTKKGCRQMLEIEPHCTIVGLYLTDQGARRTIFSGAADPTGEGRVCTNRSAWDFNEHMDRMRARLESMGLCQPVSEEPR